ncbi:MAG: polysaccharide biosynthesis protein [Clostridiales bacterium]|nr:polysaccharide biosynthesis protein [Clostridiales bacterium]
MKFLNKRFISLIYILLDIVAVSVASLAGVVASGAINTIEIGYGMYLYALISNAIITVAVFMIFKMYSNLDIYVGAFEGLKLTLSCIVVTILHYVEMMFILKLGETANLAYMLIFFLLLVALTIIPRYFRRSVLAIKSYFVNYANGDRTPVMIIGAGDAGVSLLKEIERTKIIDYAVKCFVDDDVSKIGTYIDGIKVEGNRDKIPELVKKYSIEEIYIAMPSCGGEIVEELAQISKKCGCRVKTLPGMYQFISGEVSINNFREISIEDLLSRKAVRVDLDKVMDYVTDKIVMVTGGGGSIGSELCRQIANHNPHQLIIVDIYENNAYDIQQELLKTHPSLNLVTLIASVRDSKRMERIFAYYKPQIVYHAAAHKHVPLMEESPNEAIKNNVFGTLKTAKLADKYGVKKFVLISTDKAVNPTNVMGATKRICEMIVQSYDKISNTEFVAVRFGNVLGSNGSVVPLFKKQIEAGGPVYVTHPEIIRYFMTISEAVALVIQAGAYAKGGEIFVLDMGKPVKILDLAENLIRLSGYEPYKDIEIKFTGLRPGEKLYEEMLMSEEGMQETENKLIHIGKPIEMDEEAFFAQLDKLKEVLKKEPTNARKLISEIVPTYTGNSDLTNV